MNSVRVFQNPNIAPSLESLQTGAGTENCSVKINLDENFIEDRFNYITLCIEQDYKKYINFIKKKFPNINYHEDLLQETIIQIYKRLKTSVEKSTYTRILDQNIKPQNLEAFVKSYLLQSIKQQSYFLFVNNFRKNNMINNSEAIVKEYYYGDEKDKTFSNFKENYDLQQFYSFLSPEEIVIVRHILDDSSVKEAVEQLNISNKKYYSMIVDIRNKMIEHNYTDCLVKDKRKMTTSEEYISEKQKR